MANDKKVAPSINRFAGLGGDSGDSVHFWHVGRKEFLPGIIDSVTPVHYVIFWAEEIAQNGNLIKSGYRTHVKKQNCIIHKGT